ncbi:MAG: PKD domain-containing protein [Patescibacteria group bacterium]
MTIRTFVRGTVVAMLAVAVIAPSLVLAQSALVARIDQPADNSEVIVGQSVTFRGSAENATTPGYQWTFSDGTVDAGSVVSKTFGTTGTSTITFRVTDRGVVAEDTITLRVVDDTAECTPLIVETVGVNVPRAVPESITQNSATIVWTTCEASTSRVVYDTVRHQTEAEGFNPALTNLGYALSSAPNNAKVTEHSVNLTGLTPNTTYYFRVLSAR